MSVFPSASEMVPGLQNLGTSCMIRWDSLLGILPFGLAWSCAHQCNAPESSNQPQAILIGMPHERRTDPSLSCWIGGDTGRVWRMLDVVECLLPVALRAGLPRFKAGILSYPHPLACHRAGPFCHASPPAPPSPVHRLRYTSSWAMSSIVCLIALISATSGPKFLACSKMLRGACVCSFGTRTRSLSAIVSLPCCRRLRHEHNPVLISQAG